MKDHRFYWMTAGGMFRLPNFMMPPLMSNHHCYIGSLSNVCRWLAPNEDALEVEIYPRFAAAEELYDNKGAVRRIATDSHGHHQGRLSQGFLHPAYEIASTKTPLFCRGARGGKPSPKQFRSPKFRVSNGQKTKPAEKFGPLAASREKFPGQKSKSPTQRQPRKRGPP